jgi:hypothetical protein
VHIQRTLGGKEPLLACRDLAPLPGAGRGWERGLSRACLLTLHYAGPGVELGGSAMASPVLKLVMTTVRFNVVPPVSVLVLTILTG